MCPSRPDAPELSCGGAEATRAEVPKWVLHLRRTRSCFESWGDSIRHRGGCRTRFVCGIHPLLALCLYSFSSFGTLLDCVYSVLVVAWYCGSHIVSN